MACVIYYIPGVGLRLALEKIGALLYSSTYSVGAYPHESSIFTGFTYFSKTLKNDHLKRIPNCGKRSVVFSREMQYTQCADTHIHTHTHTNIQTRICNTHNVQTHVYTCIHTQTYTHIHTRIYNTHNVQTHVYTCIHTHTYTHAYMPRFKHEDDNVGVAILREIGFSSH